MPRLRCALAYRGAARTAMRYCSQASCGRLLQRRFQELPHLGGVFRDLDAALFHDRQLLLRRASAAGDDGAGVAHAFSGRRRDPGAVGADELRPPALHPVLGADHVAHRDALGDADHQVEVRLHRLVDRRGGERRRHVDHRDIRAGLLLRFLHRGENRDAFVGFTGLLRVDARDVAIPAVGVFLSHLGVEPPGLAGDALRHHPGIFVDEDSHQLFPFAAFDPPLAAATTFCAASAMLLPEMIGSPDSARIFLPRSALVPSRRTTSGTLRLTSLAAATTPAAITSHFMMPPKILTRIAFRCGMRSMILKASVTFSVVAPPPTSRKLAGMPPNFLDVGGGATTE